MLHRSAAGIDACHFVSKEGLLVGMLVDEVGHKMIALPLRRPRKEHCRCKCRQSVYFLFSTAYGLSSDACSSSALHRSLKQSSGWKLTI